MMRIRKYVALALPITIALIIGLVVNAEIFSPQYSQQEGYVGAGSLQAELLPAGARLYGQISAENPFSAYVVFSKSGYFEGLEKAEVVMKWENVTRIELDFEVPEKGYYLVIKNGNVSQRIDMDFSVEK